jgi:hypothetical protein
MAADDTIGRMPTEAEVEAAEHHISKATQFHHLTRPHLVFSSSKHSFIPRLC